MIKPPTDPLSAATDGEPTTDDTQATAPVDTLPDAGFVVAPVDAPQPAWTPAVPASTTSSKRRGGGLFATRTRTAVTVGIAAVTVAAMIAGGVLVHTAVDRDLQVQQARTVSGALSKAEISNQAAKISLDETIAGAQQHSAEVVPIVAAAPAYLDTTAAAALEQARLDLDAAVVAVKTPDPAKSEAVAASTTFETPKVTRIVSKDATAEQAKKQTRELTAAVAAADTDADRKQAAIATITTAQDTVSDALTDVANLVVTSNAHAVRAAAPNVDQTVLEQAVTTLQISIDDADPLVPTLTGYIAAAKSVLDAQTAFNTQAAIDAANAAGNDTFVDPSTGESKPNPNYNGGGSGSGSGGGDNTGGGGGGSGADTGAGGGGSSGGGSTTPTPPRIVYGSSSCSGAGGYYEASYSGRSVVVPGSGVASVHGPYDSGSGWRVDWTCS